MRGPSITREQVRELDRIAIHEYGIAGLILMENAGRACADEAVKMLGTPAGKHVAVIAGRGNNGGDGFVLARHLSNAKATVEIFLTAPVEELLSEPGDAATNLEITLNMGIAAHAATTREAVERAMERIGEADLVVDAMLGTGISGQVREPVSWIIERLNESGRRVLAVDIPSGLDCDRGAPLGAAVRAQRTVSFVLRKTGFDAPGAVLYTGEVIVAEISIPRTVIEQKLLEWGVVTGEE